jgi:hypothetical protein
MKQKKVIVGLAVVLTITVVVIGLNFGRGRVGDIDVAVSFVGYTNVNGTSMALFKVQNNQSRRIWLRHVDYLLGEAFRKPAGAWQCSILAASNRWASSSMIPQQYLPPEPTPTSPNPTSLMVPVPTNQPLWRVGLTVEFSTTLPQRLAFAWKFRHARGLHLGQFVKRTDEAWVNRGQFINNSSEAIWVESPVITNATALSDCPFLPDLPDFFRLISP